MLGAQTRCQLGSFSYIQRAQAGGAGGIQITGLLKSGDLGREPDAQLAVIAIARDAVAGERPACYEAPLLGAHRLDAHSSPLPNTDGSRKAACPHIVLRVSQTRKAAVRRGTAAFT